MNADEHKEIWLPPACESVIQCDRTWCEDDQVRCGDCGAPWVKFIRADIVKDAIDTAEAREMERCALIADSYVHANPNSDYAAGWNGSAESIVAAIRAGKEG